MKIDPDNYILSNYMNGQNIDHSRKMERSAAQDFESFFIQMSLKEMRPKTSGLLNAGMAEEVFYQFLDEAIAKEMAQSADNFGIADAVSGEIF